MRRISLLILLAVISLAPDATAQDRPGAFPALPGIRLALEEAGRIEVAGFQAGPLAEASPAADQAAPPRADAPVFTLPASFTMVEKFFALTDTLTLKAGGRTLGKVSAKFIALTKSFRLTDASDNLVAEARARFFALGSTVDVTDAQGNRIGTIKERILKSLFKVYTNYSVLDASGREVAKSEKLDWLSTEFTLRTPSGAVVAQIRRDFMGNLFRVTDKWDATVREPKAVDPRLLVMIAAYKTSVDNDRRREEASKKSKRNDDD
ncbi:MAG TPA: hypothetical protein DD417_11100 [Elusimicrobia bacterium]|nr:hypothetical protein [Elusimicrobiota bacterium]